MRNATQGWREHGFDLEIWDLGYHGERNDVPTYLHSRGWHSVGMSLTELLAANGLPSIPHDDEASFGEANYYTSILNK